MTARLVLLAGALALSACSPTLQPPRYNVNAPTNNVLRQVLTRTVSVASVTLAAEFENQCRGVGKLTGADGKPIPEFIKDAFNEEIMFAGKHGTDVPLDLTIDRLGYSSGKMTTRKAYWDIAVTLRNPSTGVSVPAPVHYEFQTTWGGDSACMGTANALVPAVQELVYRVVSQPEFAKLTR